MELRVNLPNLEKKYTLDKNSFETDVNYISQEYNDAIEFINKDNFPILKNNDAIKLENTEYNNGKYKINKIVNNGNLSIITLENMVFIENGIENIDTKLTLFNNKDNKVKISII